MESVQEERKHRSLIIRPILRIDPCCLAEIPAFFDVSLSDLPTNPHFLNQAYTCLVDLNAYLENLGKSRKAPWPYLNALAFKSIRSDELHTYLGVLFNIVQKELGDSFTAEAQKRSWKKGKILAGWLKRLWRCFPQISLEIMRSTLTHWFEFCALIMGLVSKKYKSWTVSAPCFWSEMQKFLIGFIVIMLVAN